MKLLLAMLFLNNVEAYAGDMLGLPEFDLNLTCKTSDSENFSLNIKKEAGSRQVTAKGDYLNATGVFTIDNGKEYLLLSTKKSQNQAGIESASLEFFGTLGNLSAKGKALYDMNTCPPRSFCYDYVEIGISCTEI